MTSVDSDYGEAFQRVLDALKSVGSSVTVNGNTAMAQCPCPAHRDENPSLSITDVEGRVLLKCHAECDPEDVIAALTLRWADLFDSAARGVANGARPVSIAQYVYTDERGEPLFRVVRYEPKDFRQHRWSGTSWDSTLGSARRVLYRLPDLVAWVTSQWVFVVEGEKDAERLVAEGLVTTTIAMGSNPGNWDRTETEILDDAYVAVIGDSDASGRKYARHVANSLSGRAAEVRLLRLDGMSEKGDVSDWLDSGGTPADLVKILDSTQAWKVRRRFDGAEPFATVGDVSAYKADSLRSWARKPTMWRVRGLLVKDTHLVVGASKKTLKTTLISGEMAFAIANGTPWLGEEQFVVEAPAPVLVVINEGIKSYMKMLDRIPGRHQADSLGPVYVIDASGVNLENNDLNAVIRETAERVGAGVIIYDAWYGFVGGDKEASNLFSMSEVFKIVQEVADTLDIDPVIVHHLKKNSKGRPDLDDLTFAGVAEWADSWMLITHRSTARPDEGEYRLGLVAGSRQWGEIEYELDASFGQIDLDNGGYTQPPRWLVTKVDADRSRRWGKGSVGFTANPEATLADFIAAHPYEHTKSQACNEAPGSERVNRDAFERLKEAGTIRVARLRRSEGQRSVLRELVGPSGIDPAATGQQRLAPIGNELPTYVAQQGAGNSPKAAVSAPSEPQLDTDLGRADDVHNPDTPTLSEATSAPADVRDRGSFDTHNLARTEGPPNSHRVFQPLCTECGGRHDPPYQDLNWSCYAYLAQLQPGWDILT